jgi:GT2 family glycosyltransferase
VSVLVVSRGDPRALERCLASLERTCAGRSIEVLIVEGGSGDAPGLTRFDDPARGRRVFREPSRSGWAAIHNLAAKRATGELLLFLDERVEALAPGWLDALIEHAQRRGIGAVGPKLVDPRGRVKGAGRVLGLGGPAGDLFAGSPGNRALYFDLAGVAREVSAVAGACMLVSRRHFELVGGFDERFTGAYGDLDFCIRLRQRGLRNIFTGHSVVRIQGEPPGGSPDAGKDEVEWRRKWGNRFDADDHYSPHLSRRHADPVPRLET